MNIECCQRGDIYVSKMKCHKSVFPFKLGSGLGYEASAKKDNIMWRAWLDVTQLNSTPLFETERYRPCRIHDE